MSRSAPWGLEARCRAPRRLLGVRPSSLRSCLSCLPALKLFCGGFPPRPYWARGDVAPCRRGPPPRLPLGRGPRPFPRCPRLSAPPPLRGRASGTAVAPLGLHFFSATRAKGGRADRENGQARHGRLRRPHLQCSRPLRVRCRACPFSLFGQPCPLWLLRTARVGWLWCLLNRTRRQRGRRSTCTHVATILDTHNQPTDAGLSYFAVFVARWLGRIGSLRFTR